MNHRNLTATLLASAIALGLASPVFAHDGTPATPHTHSTADAATTAAIEASLLADPRTAGLSIDVHTHGGKVTLTGTADSNADREAVFQLATKVAGITAVENRVLVDGKLHTTIEDTDGDGVDEVGPGPDANLDNVSDLDGDGVDEVGPGPDAELNNFTDMDGDGVDEVGPGPDAEVDNFTDLDNDGVDEVGPGPDAELNNISDLDNDGVDEVGPGPDAPVNDTVGTAAAPSGSDAWITTKIKTALLAAEGVNGTAIDVDTVARIVTLSGTVRSAAEHAAAVRIAATTRGVLKVMDALLVQSR